MTNLSPAPATQYSILNLQLLIIITASFLSACGQSGKKPAPAQPPDGSLIFRQHCVSCHGADGTMGANGAKNLIASTLSEDETIAVISNGRKVMTPFRAVLSEDEIRAVAKYVIGLRQNVPS